ncbi:MAG: preprotein translocase subunit SecA [Planctomycetota bacterium]
MAAREFWENLSKTASEALARVSVGVGKAITKVVGSRNQRVLDSLVPTVQAVNALEPEMERLALEEFPARTARLKQRVADGATLDDLLVEAFALVREAAKRTLGLRHFDVQLIGGVVLHQGKIAEMATGEGKTLVATCAASLNALAGKGVHIVTVNDYLARRDAEWMGPIYRTLGFDVGAIQSHMSNAERLREYGCAITYGTNNEFGFDYLRDNMKTRSEDQVQKHLCYAIVDEVDSILIDEARTPLIISGLPEASTRKYYVADDVARRLVPGTDFEIKEKEHQCLLSDVGIEKAQRLVGVDSFYSGPNMDWPHHFEQALRAHHLYKRDKDYVVKTGEDGAPEVVIVDEFTGRQMPGRRWSDGLHQAVEAKERIRIKEETQTLATITFQNFFRLYDKLAGMTGTAMTEAAEFAKIYNLDVVSIPTNRPCVRLDHEDVIYRTEAEKWPAIVEEIADCTLSGRPVLVGTASIAKSEVMASYLADPTKMRQVLARRAANAGSALKAFKKDLPEELRRDLDELLAKPARVEPDQARELADRIAEIDVKSDLAFWVELVARAVRAVRVIEGGLRFHVLNAKHHEKEAEIVAQAGREGAVTVSTNMAGRGTDILLGGNPEFRARQEVGRDAVPEVFAAALARYKQECAAEKERVIKAGGLHILGTERHEARRIDNQLRGRSARQGDPGSSRFYLSLEDELMRIFAGERVKWILEKVGMTEGVDIQSPMVSRSIQRAQKKVENRNFEIRKNLLEYDEVMDKQRKTIYDLRQRLLEGEDVKERVTLMTGDQVRRSMEVYLGANQKEWDLEEFTATLNRRVGSALRADDLKGIDREEVEKRVIETVTKVYEQREAEIGTDEMRRVERYLLLHVIDGKWKDHLYSMDALKSGIGLRSYAQVDPKNEYKREGLSMFESLLESIAEEVTGIIFKLRVVKEEDRPVRPEAAAPPSRPAAQHDAFSSFEAQQRGREQAMRAAGRSASGRPIRRAGSKVGRNDPCPCGSGKKYKRCCGQ